MTEKPAAKKSPFKKEVNMSKLDAPIICPLLSMAAPKEEEYTDCMKEACWFYNRSLKKCVFVHMAISMARIADTLGKTQALGDFSKVMSSVERHHRP